MVTDPKLQSRELQPYVGIRSEVSAQEVSSTLPPLIGELFAWLGARGVPPTGPPFFRYRVIDMANLLAVDVGIPVAIALTGDQRVVTDNLPAGLYATVIHTGEYKNLMQANQALQDWASENGVKWQQSNVENGMAWASRLEFYLTDPTTEPDPRKWQTEIAYLTDGS
jgi:effector-binding domain-containing protein